MYAYRVRDASQGSSPYNLRLGQNDGGENGAGDLLARLLELSESEDVLIVVWRWYGGVQLGSERWRKISEVARDALNQGNFSKRMERDTEETKERKGKKKKK